MRRPLSGGFLVLGGEDDAVRFALVGGVGVLRDSLAGLGVVGGWGERAFFPEVADGERLRERAEGVEGGGVADGVLEEREGADGRFAGATGGALLCLQNCSWLGAQQTLQNHF